MTRIDGPDGSVCGPADPRSCSSICWDAARTHVPVRHAGVHVRAERRGGDADLARVLEPQIVGDAVLENQPTHWRGDLAVGVCRGHMPGHLREDDEYVRPEEIDDGN